MAFFGINDCKVIPFLILTARMVYAQTSRYWLMHVSDYANYVPDMTTSFSGITRKSDEQNDDDSIHITRYKVLPSASRRYSQDNYTSLEQYTYTLFFYMYMCTSHPSYIE